MRRVWPYLVLAGCYSEGSLEIWVEPRPGFALEEVELYVGIHDAHLGESIRPMHGRFEETVWWKRDHNRTADVLTWDVEAEDRGAIRYQLLPGGLDEVHALVAVGYATEGTSRKIVGVATYLHDAPLGSGEIYRRYLTLGDFDVLPRRDAQPMRPNVPGIQIWGPAEDPNACVQIDNAAELDLSSFGTGNATSSMIVLRDDIDCDSYTQTEQPNKDECDPAQYQSASPRTRDSLSCLTWDGAPGSTCVAGGPMCKDGAGDVDCAASTWCAPTLLCGTGTGPPVCDTFQCDNLPTGVANIVCQMTYDPNTFRWCSGTKASFTLAQYFENVSCDPTRGTMMRKPMMPSFATELTYGSIDEMWISIVAKDESICEYQLEARGPLQQSTLTANRQLSYPAAIAFPLKSPVDGRGIGLPIRFVAEQSAGCTELIGSCQLLPASLSDAKLDACITAPISDPALQVD